MNEADRNAFLELFPVEYRPAVSKIFFDLVRVHQRNVFSSRLILDAIKARLLKSPHDLDLQAKMMLLTEVITDRKNKDTISHYLDYLYEWESLSPAEKDKIKKKRNIDTPEAKERMSKLPPSPKQLECLSGLGYDGNPPENMAEASRLITQYTRRY